MQNKKSQKGFTLIELLVVISIIGVLSGIVMINLQSARTKARDIKRLSDMREIVKGIHFYYDKFGQLPPADGVGDCCTAGWNQAPCGTDTFISDLQTKGIMGNVPTDPTSDPVASGNCKGYEYALFPAGSNNCDPSRGKYFVLGVIDMETSQGTYPGSPGFSCTDESGTTDFQDSFEWVTGGYETDF